jgi:aspartyl-tRNA(Asn)/glutamyl-tRNA(Gln) amidotransferase subunit C
VPDSIDLETAQRVARLARIELLDSNAADTQQQLSKILVYVGQLNDVELPAETEPFFGVVESVNAIRPDQVCPSLGRDSILKNAPDTDGEFYKVPPVFS